MRLLLVDNHDSFTYNLAQALGQLGARVDVGQSDRLSLADVSTSSPDAVVISPGPGTPRDAGVSVALVRRFAGLVPILGVCLGHQAIGVAFGARVVRAARVMHGKVSRVEHDGSGVFGRVPSPFDAMRYHSLVLDPGSLPPALRVNAWTATGEIMGLCHRDHDVFGVQFHPESILTPAGPTILDNFVARVRDRCLRAAG